MLLVMVSMIVLVMIFVKRSLGARFRRVRTFVTNFAIGRGGPECSILGFGIIKSIWPPDTKYTFSFELLCLAPKETHTSEGKSRLSRGIVIILWSLHNPFGIPCKNVTNLTHFAFFISATLKSRA